MVFKQLCLLFLTDISNTQHLAYNAAESPIRQIETQGDNAPAWVRDCVTHHDFLDYAMRVHELGVFEHKPYSKIEYNVVEV